MLKRFFHNARQTLIKDDGAHFTYNLGVGFVRLGAVLLGAALLLFAAFEVNIGGWLSYKGEGSAMVRDMRIDKREVRESRSHNTRTYLVHYITFDCSYGSTSMVVEQSVPEKVYSFFAGVSRSESTPVKVYRTTRHSLYVSCGGWFTAQKEYNATHTDNLFGLIAAWLSGIGVFVIGIGLGEERLAMKYPRTDVDISENAIVSAEEKAYTDELLKEFDEAFEKFQANKAAGLPTSEPPRTDGKKYGEETLRLEKKN